jgi:hypothetical protein
MRTNEKMAGLFENLEWDDARSAARAQFMAAMRRSHLASPFPPPHSPARLIHPPKNTDKGRTL